MTCSASDWPGWRADGPWHEDELVLLRRAWLRGDAVEEIAAAHRRSAESVKRALRAVLPSGLTGTDRAPFWMPGRRASASTI
ncbi:MAG TPA: hypothetical protein VEA81_01075 [Burkholderiaceae bacterium]|nr:hypothetical protein [Burkholderiaceae bacterium]